MIREKVEMNDFLHDRYLKVWKMELKEAVKDCDIDKFRAFYEKWEKRGIYDKPLPDDDRLIEATMRYIVLADDAFSFGDRVKAKEWLREHGFSENPSM